MPNRETAERVWWPRNPFEGRPGLVQKLLQSEDGTTYGYGYGSGWNLIFGSAQGDIEVPPGSWILKHEDGTIEVVTVDFATEPAPQTLADEVLWQGLRTTGRPVMDEHSFVGDDIDAPEDLRG